MGHRGKLSQEKRQQRSEAERLGKDTRPRECLSLEEPKVTGM